MPPQFVVIRNCLSPDEVAACNAAIDRHAHLITRPHDSYAHGSQALRGENNLITKLARALGGDLSAAGERMATAYEIARGGDGVVKLGRLRATLAAAAPDKASVLGAVAEKAVDMQHLLQVDGCVGDDRVVQLGTSRGDLGGMLEWEQPDCEPFRELLCHPRIKPALETLLGTNYRMDHSPDLMTADQGDDGHYLHGGNYEAFGVCGTLTREVAGGTSYCQAGFLLAQLNDCCGLFVHRARGHVVLLHFPWRPYALRHARRRVHACG